VYIFLFHKGNPWYLKYALDQLRFANPQAAIYLVGDEANAHYKGVRHVAFNAGFEAASLFTKAYRHLSDNQFDYELICFLRWFYIYDVLEKMDDQPFFYIDSDVLVYEDLAKLRPLITGKIANTVCGTGLPSVSFYSGKDALKAFIDYCIKLYTTDNGVEKISKWHQAFVQLKKGGGVCDMTIFQFFDEDHPGWVQKIERPGKQLAVDTSLQAADGFNMRGGLKHLHFKHRQPYGTDAHTSAAHLFVALHFQGDLKYLMPRYYKGNNLAGKAKFDVVRLLVEKYYHRLRRLASKSRTKINQALNG
jgi:hypothetical protein